MTLNTRFVSLFAAGMVASVGLADPADVSGAFDAAPGSATSASWLTYIGGVVGPSNIAPVSTESPARIEQSRNSLMYLTLAGPSNTAGGSGVTLSLDLGDIGNGPGPGTPGGLAPTAPNPNLVQSLQSADQAQVLTHRVDPSPEPGPGGGFQVVVPLPSAGLLTAGGLAFVAVRRRR